MRIAVTIVCGIVGFVLGDLLARWLFRCAKIGHVLEYRRQIDGAHYRDPGVEACRVCNRCGYVESVDKITPPVTGLFTMTDKTNKTLTIKSSVAT